MRLFEIPGYTPDDWQADRERIQAGESLGCPNCGHLEWFYPVGIPAETGADRKYRACKVCGFWQEADGTPPYRCLMTVHTCLGHIADNTQCAYCGAWGPVHWHAGCWRILPAKELGSTSCTNCSTVLDPSHVIPWPIQAA